MKNLARSTPNEHVRTIQQTKRQRLGLSTLYPPAGSSIIPLLDIILVHGLNGHYVNTWSADDGTVWPVDLLPKQLPDVRVMTFGYRGTYNDTTSVATTNDHGLSLLKSLMDSRKAAHEAMRPIIFVGHSLGGIIIKQALLNAKKHSDSEPRAHNLLQSTYGAIFFSTPHNGIKARDWEQFVRRVVENTKPHKSRHVPISSEMAKAIRHNSNELVQISQDFRFLKNISYVSFWEEFITPKLGKVLVTKDSATMNVGHEDIRKISRHHFDICRFSREDDGDFQQVLHAIKSIQQDSPKAKDLGDMGREVLDSLRIDELRTKPLVVEHTKDTCGWITEKPNFKRWKDPPSSKENKLWILGKLGCGKTYLAKHIVDVEIQRGHIVAQCFLQEISESHNTSHTILLVLLHKVLESCPQLINKHLVEVYDKRHTRKDIWGYETLRWLWPKVVLDVTAAGRLTLIVDGLDQCGDDAKAFFECFEECENSVTKPGFLKLLVVSRECPAFFDHSSRLSFITYQITELDTREDIKKTVRHSLESTVLGGRYKSHLRNLMYEKIPKGANGMYLWARIMTDEIKLACLSEGQLESELSDLPTGIIELYDRVLGRIGQNSEQKGLIRIVLFWTVFRHEVLKTEELRVGIAMSTLTAIRNNMNINEETIGKFLPQCSIQITIARLCGHLVKFSANKVNLVHGSLKQFLITSTGQLRQKYPKVQHHENFFFRETDSHKVISDFCVAYLLLRSFEDSGKPFDPKSPGPLEWEKKVHQRVRQHVFVGYAALSWIAHCRLSEEVFSVNDNGDRYQRVLLDLQNQQAISWTEVWWYLRKWRFRRHNYPRHGIRLDDHFGIEAGSVNPSISSSDGGQQPRTRQRIAPPPLQQDIRGPSHFLLGTETQITDAVNPPLATRISEQYVPSLARPSDSLGRQTEGSSPWTRQSVSLQAYSEGRKPVTLAFNFHQPQIAQEQLHTQSRGSGVSTSHRHQLHAATETFSGPRDESTHSQETGNISGPHWNRDSGAYASSQSSVPGDWSPADRNYSRTQGEEQNELDNASDKPIREFTTLPEIEEEDETASKTPVESTSRRTALAGWNIGPRSVRSETTGRALVQNSGPFGTAPEFPTTPPSVSIHQLPGQHLRNRRPNQKPGVTALNRDQTISKQHETKVSVIKGSQRGNSAEPVIEEMRGSARGDALEPKNSNKAKKEPPIQAPPDGPQQKGRPIATTPNLKPNHGRIKPEPPSHTRPRTFPDPDNTGSMSSKTNKSIPPNTNISSSVSSSSVFNPGRPLQEGTGVLQDNSLFPPSSVKAIPTSRKASDEEQVEPTWTERDTGSAIYTDGQDFHLTSATKNGTNESLYGGDQRSQVDGIDASLDAEPANIEIEEAEQVLSVPIGALSTQRSRRTSNAGSSAGNGGETGKSDLAGMADPPRETSETRRTENNPVSDRRDDAGDASISQDARHKQLGLTDAQGIMRTKGFLQTQFVEPKADFEDQPDQNEPNADEKELDVGNQEELPDLVAVDDFLTSRHAMDKLRTSIQEFVEPSVDAEKDVIDPADNIESFVAQGKEERPSATSSNKEGDLEDNFKRHDKSACDPDPRADTESNASEETLSSQDNQQAWVELARETISTFIATLGGLCYAPFSSLASYRGEQPLQPGKRRVRWTCWCGERLYDDFIESRPGAIQELEASLNGHIQTSNSRNANSSAGGTWINLFYVFSSFKSGKGSIRTSQNSLPMHNTAQSSRLTASQPGNTAQSPRLLLCIGVGQSGTKVYQEPMNGVESDWTLFGFLNEAYRNHRRIRSWICLRTVISIDLVKFFLDASEYCDIRLHDQGCGSTAITCTCLPPPDRVKSATTTGAEYRCEPIPAGTIPPAGKNYMMHYFRKSHRIFPTSTRLFNQVPKRLAGRLEAKPDGIEVGWGVYFHEGWHWEAVFGLLLLVGFVGSMLFGILWSVFKKDIQGAFGVASYWVTATGLLIGFIAARQI